MELAGTWASVRTAEDARPRVKEIHLHCGYEWCSVPASTHTFPTYLTQDYYEAAEHALHSNTMSSLHKLSAAQFI